MASPMTLKRGEIRAKDEKASNEAVAKWLNETLKRKVNVPDDLKTGVVFCEVLNKLSPKSVEKFDAAPKNVFAQADNFKKVSGALHKFGFPTLDIPSPMDAASGKANSQLVNILSRLSVRSTTLKAAPEAFVTTQKKKAAFHKLDIRVRRSRVKRDRKMRILGAIRAARYQRFYRHLRERTIKKHIEARKHGNFYVPDEPRVAFVMRLRGINGVAPKYKKILQLFRLRQIHNAVFVRLNRATLQMLKAIEPYVAIGYPSVRSIRALLIKRGYACIRHQRIPITSNKLIDKHLGRHGVHNMDDLVWQITRVGKHFARCNRFLYPFKMNSPRGGYGKSKLRHFVEGGAAGNRMGMINKLIRQCL